MERERQSGKLGVVDATKRAQRCCCTCHSRPSSSPTNEMSSRQPGATEARYLSVVRSEEG